LFVVVVVVVVDVVYQVSVTDNTVTLIMIDDVLIALIASKTKFSNDTCCRKPLFRYCYECGRSVNVHLTPCSRCKEVYYCSKPCQNKAWQTVHKNECLRIPPGLDWI